MQNDSHFAKVSQSLIKLNIHLPYNPTLLLLGIYPNELKITYTHIKTCMQRFIHNYQKWETIKMSFSDQMINKQCYIHIRECYSAIKIICDLPNKLDGSYTHFAKWKKPDPCPHPKGYIFYNPIYMTFWKRQSCQGWGTAQKISGWQKCSVWHCGGGYRILCICQNP